MTIKNLLVRYLVDKLKVFLHIILEYQILLDLHYFESSYIPTPKSDIIDTRCTVFFSIIPVSLKILDFLLVLFKVSK